MENSTSVYGPEAIHYKKCSCNYQEVPYHWLWPFSGTAPNLKRSDMKKNAKEKAAKADMPDLVTAMMKLVERLEVLEKKTDSVLGRVSNLPSEMRHAVQNLQRPEPSHFTPPSQHPGEVKQGQAPQGHRERILHKAVCADCHKDCEVPFKPTGDRPVYCKECFSKRKAGNPPKAVVVPNPPKRQVVVTKKGVGKVTVSEIARPSARGKKKKR